MNISTAKNESFDLSTFKIRIEGVDIPDTYQIVSISVKKSINRIPSAQIVLADGDVARQDFVISSGDLFVPGKEIEILAGYHGKNELIFRGMIIEHGISSRIRRSSRLIIKCKDKAVRMTLGRKNEIYKNSKDSDAIEEILDDYELGRAVTETATRHQELVKYAATDWDFMVTRAEKNGLLVVVDNGDVSLFAPDMKKEPVFDLVYGDNIFEFEANIDSRRQVNGVSGVSWDYADQRIIEEEADAPDFEEPGNLPGKDLAKSAPLQRIQLKHSGNLPDQELRAWANTKLLKSRLAKITGRIKTQGFAEIKPGDLISLLGVGARFAGKHLVSGISHSISSTDWETDIQIGLSETWFTDINDINDKQASGLIPSVNGLQIGIVSQLEKDPTGDDRILVKMPVFDADDEGIWARVARLDAGKDRGSFFLPEIGDEVIVGYISDDPRNPVVLGMLNSSAKPAPIEATDDNHEKGFVTRSQMKLAFNDEKKILTLSTPKKKKIEINEDAGTILITDENGNALEMTSNGISITSSGEINISAKKDLNLKGLNLNSEAKTQFSAQGKAGVEIKSSGIAVLKGSLVKIN
jgi:Rhs element Vgr protein